MRITAQLIFAAKDTNVWAQAYDRDLRDVLTLQSTVAGAIAKEIDLELTPHMSQLKNVHPPPFFFFFVFGWPAFASADSSELAYT